MLEEIKCEHQFFIYFAILCVNFIDYKFNSEDINELKNIFAMPFFNFGGKSVNGQIVVMMLSFNMMEEDASVNDVP